MEKIKAKPVSSNFWVLHHKNKKIGQVIHCPRGYEVKINGVNTETFPSLKTLKASEQFEFTEIPKPKATISNDVHGYPTDKTAYNAVWNLQYKLPLFTYTDDSKSWYAAGYYKIFIKGKESIEYCPKLITLRRNKHKGPFTEAPQLLFDQLIKLS